MLTNSDILNFRVSLGSYENFINEILTLAKSSISSYVCLANVHQLVEAKKDPSFANVIRNADIITPDGVPLTWAIKLFHGLNQERVAGMTLLPDLLNEAEKRELPVFFYGGSEDLLETTRRFLGCKFPKLLLAGMYSPPFRPLQKPEEDKICNLINSSGAKLIFVVLGCPKQEFWMASMKNRINSTMVGVGGALPVMVNLQKRAPVWMQKYGLEWLYRLVQEPKRLWKRYLITNTYFFFLIIYYKLSFSKNSKQTFFGKKTSKKEKSTTNKEEIFNEIQH